MRTLGIRDLQTLNASVLALNSDTSSSSFAQRLSAALTLLVPADFVAIECFSPSGIWTGRYSAMRTV